MKFTRCFFVALLSMLLVPQVLFAQTTGNPNNANIEADVCQCFCRTLGGAKDEGQKGTPTACRTTCEATPGAGYLGCYYREDSFPENNALCWTRTE